MNVIKYFSPLLKEPNLKDDLPIVIRVRKFDEIGAREFSNLMRRAQNRRARGGGQEGEDAPEDAGRQEGLWGGAELYCTNALLFF